MSKSHSPIRSRLVFLHSFSLLTNSLSAFPPSSSLPPFFFFISFSPFFLPSFGPFHHPSLCFLLPFYPYLPFFLFKKIALILKNFAFCYAKKSFPLKFPICVQIWASGPIRLVNLAYGTLLPNSTKASTLSSQAFKSL